MCLYHVSDNTLVNLIRVLILIPILILIQEFIESTTDNVIIVFTSQFIQVVVVVRKSGFLIKSTSLQACSADLPASLAGLLGRFAPSGFALRARIKLASLARVSRFALTKIFEKKSVSQSTQNALKHVKMQKKIFYPI